MSDQRLKDALFGQGVIAAYGGPKDPGTASIKLMHYQGDLEGQGPVWGYVKGGMGMISFAIADAAREAGAHARRRRPGRRDHCPARASRSRTARCIRARTVLCNADPKRRAEHARRDVPDDYRARLEAWKIRSPVVKFNAALTRAARTGPPRPARPGPRRPRSTSPAASRTPSAPSRRCDRGEPARRLRRDLHPDRLRPDARARGPPPAQRLRPVRALRARMALGHAPRRGRAPVHRPDRPLRARLRGHPRDLRGARPARHRGAHRPHRRQHLPGRGHARTRCGSTA